MSECIPKNAQITPFPSFLVKQTLGRVIGFLKIFLLIIISHNAFSGFFASAIGPAIQNDASGIYYNPASLTLLPDKQLLLGGGYVTVKLSLTETSSMDSQSITSNTINRLPMAFLSVPIGERLIVGLGALYPYLGNQDFPDSSKIRYLSTYQFISAFDLTPVITYKVDDKLAIGLGVDFEDLNLIYDSQIPSTQTDYFLFNQLKSKGVGWHGGVLYQPKKGTLIGLGYHSSIHYNLRGTSLLETPNPLLSNNLMLNTNLPAHIVFSIDQFFNEQWGVVGTVRYTQWSIIQQLTFQNLAFIIGNQDVILPSSTFLFNLKDTWTLQLGTHYSPNSKFTAKAALTLDGEPIDPNYLIGPENNLIASVIALFKLNTSFNIELNYSYMLYIPQMIRINTPFNTIEGKSSGNREIFFGKLIWNFN